MHNQRSTGNTKRHMFVPALYGVWSQLWVNYPYNYRMLAKTAMQYDQLWQSQWQIKSGVHNNPSICMCMTSASRRIIPRKADTDHMYFEQISVDRYLRTNLRSTEYFK